jgi:hypothetical protein
LPIRASRPSLPSYNVPTNFVHLPVSPEIGAQRYVPTNHKSALLSDLRREIGSSEIDAFPYILVAPADLPRFQISPADPIHPSLFGMQTYGESLAEFVLDSRATRSEAVPQSASPL